ncbi:hypothetical protein [Streptomyces sp. NPDC001966]
MSPRTAPPPAPPLAPGTRPAPGCEVDDAPDAGSASDTGDDPCDGPVRYPQLEETAAPVGSRRRLPRDLAAAIDACLRPDPAARPTVPELAEALGGVPPRQARHRPGETS